MKTYAMILQNRVIDVLKDRETEPYYPPDPLGNPVTAIPCGDTVELGSPVPTQQKRIFD